VREEILDWHGFGVYEWNVPLPLPGNYLITNKENGKQYVGVAYRKDGVAGRGKRHTVATTKLLNLAIKKYGIGAFTFEPIFYLRPETTLTEEGLAFLFEVETAMIAAWDTVTPNGYNISAGGETPNGEAFVAAVKEAWADPAKKAARVARNAASGRHERNGATHKALWEDPNYYAKMQIAHSAGRNRPEVVAARIKVLNAPATRAAQQAIMQTEEFRKKQAASLAAAYERDPTIASRIARSVSALHQDPAYREAYLAGRAKAAPKIAKALTGRKLSDEHRENTRSGMLKEWSENPRCWITNGIDAVKVLVNDPIPEGWYRGRGKAFDKEWITNGEKSLRVDKGSPIPEGWRRGRK
jgi:hypothetical protein